MGGQTFLKKKINFDSSIMTDYLKSVWVIALIPLLYEKIMKHDFQTHLTLFWGGKAYFSENQNNSNLNLKDFSTICLISG